MLSLESRRSLVSSHCYLLSSLRTSPWFPRLSTRLTRWHSTTDAIPTSTSLSLPSRRPSSNELRQTEFLLKYLRPQSFRERESDALGKNAKLDASNRDRLRVFPVLIASVELYRFNSIPQGLGGTIPPQIPTVILQSSHGFTTRNL